MTVRHDDEFELDRIRDGIDAVRFIGRYVRLKKSGAQFQGLCPFHKERTPSFTLQPDKKLWHCHGCGLGGDLFSFAQRIEGLDFPHAKQFLANEAGVALENFSESDRRDWARIHSDRELAAEWRDGLVEVARDLRNSFFEAYHRALRYIVKHGLDSELGNLAADVYEFYEARYMALDEKIDILLAADIDIIVDQWRARRGKVVA